MYIVMHNPVSWLHNTWWWYSTRGVVKASSTLGDSSVWHSQPYLPPPNCFITTFSVFHPSAGQPLAVPYGYCPTLPQALCQCPEGWPHFKWSYFSSHSASIGVILAATQHPVQSLRVSSPRPTGPSLGSELKPDWKLRAHLHKSLVNQFMQVHWAPHATNLILRNRF